MAETTTKRHRDAAVDPQTETPKRHKLSHINDQQETTQELLDFLTNLQPDPFLELTHQPEPDPDNKTDPADDGDEKGSVIRHLLEASDDELGIPSRVDDDVSGGGDDFSGGGGDVIGSYGDICVGLWELEDEVANYYTLLQSELFME